MLWCLLKKLMFNWIFERVFKKKTFSYSRDVTVSYVISVRCPHVSGRLPPDRFPHNSILGTFMTICGGNPNLVKVGRKYRPRLRWYPSSRVQTRPKPSYLFSGRKKNPQHAFLRKGSKAVCPNVADLRHVKEPDSVCVEVAAFGRNYQPFLAQVVPTFTTRVSGGETWRCK